MSIDFGWMAFGLDLLCVYFASHSHSAPLTLTLDIPTQNREPITACLFRRISQALSARCSRRRRKRRRRMVRYQSLYPDIQQSRSQCSMEKKSIGPFVLAYVIEALTPALISLYALTAFFNNVFEDSLRLDGLFIVCC
jgi:hypothetical protein